jgi:hypothetical protein
MPIFSMTQMDARISELVARLTVLERERAEIVAEIDALPSAHDAGTEAVKVVPSGRADDPTDRNSPIEKKIAFFRRLFRGRNALPPSLIARLIRLAAFQNPEFYAAQAMRRSTHDKPRIISCAELTQPSHCAASRVLRRRPRSAYTTWNCSND